MGILAGLATLIGTGVVVVTKFSIVDLPTIIANAGTIIVSAMQK